MGIFSDHVRRYFDHGLITIPCKDKRPILGRDWQQYCDTTPTEAMIDRWEKDFSGADQLGLVMGKTTKLCALDFDYEFGSKSELTAAKFEKDRINVEKQILALLPGTPAIKTGKKGWTRFFKTHGDIDNVSCDRNGLRLFDFLARNKQTIIPPSRYNENLMYRWLGPAAEDVLDDIPIITQDIINELRLVLSDKDGYDFNANGRHGRLLKYLLDIVRIESDNKKVAHRLVELDKSINAVPYLSDPKHTPRHKSAEQNAIDWIVRVRKFVGVQPKKGQVGDDGWNYFFDTSFKSVRKDIISKNVFFKIREGEDWTRMDGVDGMLRAYADQRGLYSAKTMDQFERWTWEKVNCDFLCDIPKWDGVDRVQKFGESVKSAEFTGHEIAAILKHWGGNVFRRVKSADHQNRCVILKGPQGVGKDFMVRAMLRDFKPYYESTTMPGTQKDALEICSRLLAVHIEEFDQTKNMDVAFLKSLITQPSAFFRESYGASPNQKVMRPSFISTANVDDILRDPTGNRRFIVVPVEGIEWNYPQGESMQVLAQWRAYADTGELESLPVDVEAKVKAIVDAFTPDDSGLSIIELYTEAFDLLTRGKTTGLRDDFTQEAGKYNGKRHLTGGQVLPAIGNIARIMQCHTKTVLSRVKANGLSHRTRTGIYYYRTAADCDAARAAAPKQRSKDEQKPEW